MERTSIIGYTRESTRDQVLNGFNMVDQEKKIKVYFDLYYGETEYELEIMREEGKSGRKLKRPIFEQIVERINKGTVKILIIHNLDRLTRSIKDLGMLLDLFEKNGIQLVSIAERIDTTTPMGRFFVYLIVLLAQWEVENLADRVNRGVNESAMQGNYPKGGKPPMGYRRDEKRLIIEEEEAEVVKLIFSGIASGEYSILAMLKFLKKNKILDMTWGENTLWNLLKNPIYYGTFSWKGYEIENHTQPIISKELFVKAHEQMKKRKKVNFYKYQFKDKIYCDTCETRCIQHPTLKKGKEYIYYECPNCKKRINEKKLVELIDEDLSKIYTTNFRDVHEEKLKEEHKNQVSTINTLTRNLSGSIITAADFEQAIEYHRKQAEKLLREISKYSTSKKKFVYHTLPFSIKRKFITGCIYKIIVNLVTKIDFKIITKDEFLENVHPEENKNNI